jgi:glycerol kinase
LRLYIGALREFCHRQVSAIFTLYFDIQSGEYYSEMLDFIGVDKKMLPALYDSEMLSATSGAQSLLRVLLTK